MNKQQNKPENSPLAIYAAYLKKRGYEQTTIMTYSRQVIDFMNWCKDYRTTPYKIDYKTCLDYIKHLHSRKLSKRSVNLELLAVKKYLNYLVSNNMRTSNPIEDTTIKGVKRVINYNLLDSDELEDLYYSYRTDSTTNTYQLYTSKRDKMVVGLMVYQGLDTKDLQVLEVDHLQIHKGKLYVPSRKRSNARELELKPWQIMEFMEYINTVRPVLIKRLKNYEDTGKLIPSGDRFVIINIIMRNIKNCNTKVESTKQIRASVITHWLAQYNLRKVQYLVGHRYISSTERYLQDDLENLHEMVNKFHPIS